MVNNKQTEGRKDRVGRVSVENYKGSYRLRWYYLKTPYVITVGKATEDTYKVAVAKAQEISSDITMERLDTTLAKYSPKHAKKLAIAEKPVNLLDLINAYQKNKGDSVGELTKVNVWKPWATFVVSTDNPQIFELNNAEELLDVMKDTYSITFVRTMFESLINPATNLGIKTERIPKNPYSTIDLPKRAKRVIDSYEDYELKIIFEALEGDRFYSFIRFLSLTGCRPSEAVALTKKDLKNNFIIINKTYTPTGGVKKSTKTYVDRAFPINNQLRHLLDGQLEANPDNRLLFTNNKDGYVNANTIRKICWYHPLQKLILQKKLDRRLPLYSLRSSFITRQIRSGMDIATVARVSGNSPQVILTNYLKTRTDVVLDEVNF